MGTVFKLLIFGGFCFSVIAVILSVVSIESVVSISHKLRGIHSEVIEENVEGERVAGYPNLSKDLSGIRANSISEPEGKPDEVAAIRAVFGADPLPTGVCGGVLMVYEGCLRELSVDQCVCVAAHAQCVEFADRCKQDELDALSGGNFFGEKCTQQLFDRCKKIAPEKQ